MGRTLVWVVVGGLALILLGMVVLKIFAVLVKFLFSALIMLALVFGAVYLLSRATGRLPWRSRKIR